jgi:hypothetical protein
MSAVYAVGRFQPPTIGHAKMIQAVIEVARQKNAKAFVFVSSSQGTGKEKLKNPLTSTQKVKYLKLMFPTGVTFVNTVNCTTPCGGPLGGRGWLNYNGYTDLTLVAGGDREKDFGPNAPMWKGNGPAFVALPRDESEISGTKTREFAENGDIDSFRKAVMVGNMTVSDADSLFQEVREGLKNVRSKMRAGRTLRKKRRRATRRRY